MTRLLPTLLKMQLLNVSPVLINALSAFVLLQKHSLKLRSRNYE